MEALRRLLPYLPRIVFVLGTFIVLIFMSNVLPFFSSDETPDTALAEPTATPTQVAEETPTPTPAQSATPTPTVASPPPAIEDISDGAGRYILAEVFIDNARREFEIGFYTGPEGSSPTPQYVVRFDGVTLYALDGGAGSDANGQVRIGSVELGISYRVLIHVLGAELGGTSYYITGGRFGALGDEWSFLWRTRYATNVGLRPLGLVPEDSNLVRSFDSGEVESFEPAVFDLFDFPAAGISRLSGRTLRQPFGAVAWESQDGNDIWFVKDGVARSTLSRQTAIVESNISDGLISARLTPWNISGLIVRYTDADNWIGVRRQGLNDSLLIVRRENGSTSEIGSAPLPFDVVGGGILDVYLKGDQIRVRVNGVEALTVTEPFNQDATMHGLWSFGDTARFADFAVWPTAPEFAPR